MRSPDLRIQGNKFPEPVSVGQAGRQRVIGHLCRLVFPWVITMTSALHLPYELWLRVFSFLSWKDKLSMRCTCSHFKRLMDESRPVWRGFSVVLKDLSRYNRAFWRSLARRQLTSVSLRAGKKRDLKLLSVWLPLLGALRLDNCRGNDLQELKRFHLLNRLTLTACSTPLVNLEFLLPLSHQLTQLSLCNVQLTCPASQLLASISQLTRLGSLLLHHDGSLAIPTLRGVLSQLVNLRFLSWTMINYKRLSQDFFLPGTGAGGHPLVVYADFLPSSLLSLTLCVDLQPEDLHVVSLRAPNLQHLHLEPWSSSSNLVRLLPQLFPCLKTLAIRSGAVLLFILENLTLVSVAVMGTGFHWLVLCDASVPCGLLPYYPVSAQGGSEVVP
ncbi:hypothetical protein XENOCAPTIV_016447 [Xenoophorus captivus]|uniref:F-box domain-containing protein n=1 Tax=Xenoophorus captivus TaxID=1517983 RepID=A0ABV0RHM3_9TELE